MEKAGLKLTWRKIQDVELTVPTVNVHGGALDAGLNLTEQKE